MRIVVISRSLPMHGGSGGMEAVAWNLVKAWSDRHDVICLTTPSRSSFETGSIRVEQLAGRPGRYTAGWLKGVKDRALALEPDVVMGVSAGAHALARMRGRSFPVVMQAHGTSILEVKRRLEKPSFRGILGAGLAVRGLLVDVHTYPAYDSVVAVSGHVQGSIEALPRWARPPVLSTIPNGVHADDATVALHDDSFPPQQTGPKLLYVGRLHRQKGADIAIESLVGSDATLVVAGEGGDRSHLEALADMLGVQNRVHFAGRLDETAISALYKSADAVLAPSRGNEGLSLVGLETLRAGKPLISSPGFAAGFGSTLPRGVYIAEPSGSSFREVVRSAITQSADQYIGLPDEYTLERSAKNYIRHFEELQQGKREASGDADD